MKTIVVPTDFSAISLNAVDYAAEMACIIGTALSLIHVCRIPIPISEVPVPAHHMDELIAYAEDQLQHLKAKIMQNTGDRLIIHTRVLMGDAVAGIESYCSSVNPYAVVMGAESYSAFERFFFGGKTVSALRQLAWPLVVVPLDVVFSGLSRIGLACDLRKVHETVPVEEIKALVTSTKAKLHLLHVMAESDNVGDTTKSREWLMGKLKDVYPDYHLIKGEDYEESIARYAKKNRLDLLIVIPKKYSPLNKLFRHSHSKRLVLHAHVPVMAIHAL